MLRSPKLKKGQVTSRGPKWGVPKIAPPIFLDLGSLAQGPKMGGAKSNPQCVNLRGQLPTVKAYLGVDQNYTCSLASWCRGDDGGRNPPLCGGSDPPCVDDVYYSQATGWVSLV